jgi:hypothetical protein
VDIKSRLDWPGERRLLETFVFPRKLCRFLQDDDTDSYSSVAVVCCRSSMTLQVRVALLGEEIVPIGTCEIPTASSSEEEIVILAVTCSASGVLSLFGVSSMLVRITDDGITCHRLAWNMRDIST